MCVCLHPSLSWHLAECSPPTDSKIDTPVAVHSPLISWKIISGPLINLALEEKQQQRLQAAQRGQMGMQCVVLDFIILQRNVGKSHAWTSHYTHTFATHICQHCIVGAVSLSIGVVGRLKKGKTWLPNKHSNWRLCSISNNNCIMIRRGSTVKTNRTHSCKHRRPKATRAAAEATHPKRDMLGTTQHKLPGCQSM